MPTFMLKQLAFGTEFKCEAGVFRVTAAAKGATIRCEPKLGGRFQTDDAIVSYIDENTPVTVHFDSLTSS